MARPSCYSWGTWRGLSPPPSPSVTAARPFPRPRTFPPGDLSNQARSFGKAGGSLCPLGGSPPAPPPQQPAPRPFQPSRMGLGPSLLSADQQLSCLGTSPGTLSLGSGPSPDARKRRPCLLVLSGSLARPQTVKSNLPLAQQMAPSLLSVYPQWKRQRP